jgi:hypothetical protein
MIVSLRPGRRTARAPLRASLALPGLLALLLALLAARAGLTLVRDGDSPPASGATTSEPRPGDASPDGATPDGSSCPDHALPPALCPQHQEAAAEAAGGKGRPSCPGPEAATLPAACRSPLEHRAAAHAGGSRPVAGQLSLQAPCSQRAPPSSLASPARGG